MRAIKMILGLTLGVLTSHALATFVPVSNEVVEASIKSEGGTHYLDGYVQLNKSARTISLLLQPVMPPCPEGEMCTESMPAALDYFLDDVRITIDECGAVIHQAEQKREHLIRVSVIDNSSYDYTQCPSFLPVPATVVLVDQIFYYPSNQEERQEYLVGDGLANIRY